ncbi:MAG: MATE family efflux transporter [Firmicutes bacterium]|jgi:putative MATE family efflux protein|nr:MATE family efflux transporter [Bacillota bacterium]
MDNRNELLEDSMGSLFMKLAVPGIVGMLIIGLYNFVDAIFVGQLVGKDGVAAIALLYSVVLLNQGILTIVGSGSMAILSISIGKKDQKTIDKLLGNMIIFIVIASGVLTVLTYIFSNQLVTIIGGTGSVHSLAVRYLRVLLIGFIPAALGPAMNFLLRGEGKMKHAMVIAGGAGILNIILDPILISGLKMGIEGAALATIISQTIFMIVQFIYFKSGKSVVSISKLKIRIEKSVIADVLKLGSSQMFMCVMMMVQQIFLFRSLEHFGGNNHISLMGGTFRLFMFAYLIVWGIGTGLQPIVGVNYGAKQYGRVKESFKKFSLIGAVITTICWVLFMSFPQFFLSLFIKDADLIVMGIPYFKLFNIIFFAYIYFATVLNLFIGLGKAKEAGILAIGRQVLFFVPMVLILPRFLGVWGVWLSLPLADGVTIILGFYNQYKIFKSEEFREEELLRI